MILWFNRLNYVWKDIASTTGGFYEWLSGWVLGEISISSILCQLEHGFCSLTVSSDSNNLLIQWLKINRLCKTIVVSISTCSKTDEALLKIVIDGGNLQEKIDNTQPSIQIISLLLQFGFEQKTEMRKPWISSGNQKIVNIFPNRENIYW